MASVIFDGYNEVKYSLELGGIAGHLEYGSYSENCANFGPVIHSGTSSQAYIGGIVGYSSGYGSLYNVKIQNSHNYGNIIYNGTSLGNLYIGGITGFVQYVYTNNCVSAGRIIALNISIDVHIGGIVGFIFFKLFC